MLNKVTLIGNLGRDPEIRHLDSGSMVAKFPMATNESYRDKAGEWQTRTEWHDVVCWRGLAERVERQLKKGHLVYVEGKLTTRKWQDRDGNDRYTTEVVANIVKSLEKRESTGRTYDSFPTAEDEFQVATAEKPAQGAQDFSSVEDDDLPF